MYIQSSEVVSFVLCTYVCMYVRMIALCDKQVANLYYYFLKVIIELSTVHSCYHTLIHESNHMTKPELSNYNI